MRVLGDAHATWHNPSFARPYLLVRNAREAACYRLEWKDCAERSDLRAASSFLGSEFYA
jgi:hypothetical protein